MPPRDLTIEQVLTLLAETPRRMDELTAGMAAEKLQIPPAPGQWSANEVLAHLRACADVWGDGMVAMLSQNTPTLRHVSPRSWIKKTGYLREEFRPSLKAFTLQRAELLARFESSGRESWSRKGMVKKAGKVLERTVLFYASGMAAHEQAHLGQIQRIAHTMHTRPAAY